MYNYGCPSSVTLTHSMGRFVCTIPNILGNQLIAVSWGSFRYQ